MSNLLRKSIATEFHAIDLQKDNIGGLAFFSNRYKRSREWHVLGSMQRLLKTRSNDIPEFAEESVSPDFMTYRSDGSRWHPVEITEVLRPEYRRHEYYQKTRDNGPTISFLPPPLERPWEELQKRISNKAHVEYDRPTCLLIYLSLWLFDFPTWSKPVQDQLVDQHKKEPFRDVDRFARVLVLTSGMDTLVELTAG
jgi:hypothetical protein